MLGLGVDVPITESWVINLQLRRRFLNSNVYNSPLISRKAQDIGLIALSYRFKLGFGGRVYFGFFCHRRVIALLHLRRNRR